MRKMKTFLIFLLIFVFSSNIHALCEDEYLKSLVNEFKVYIVEDEDMMVEIPGIEGEVLEKAEYAYLLLISPDSSDLVYKVTYDNEVEYAKYSYKYGTYAVGSYVHFIPKTYNIEVYGKPGTACSNEKLLERKYTIDAYNEYSGSNYCMEHKEEEICRINYDSSKITDEDKDKINNGNENINDKNNLTVFDKIVLLIKKGWIFILIPILIISLFYVIKIKSYKKKESSR